MDRCCWFRSALIEPIGANQFAHFERERRLHAVKHFLSVAFPLKDPAGGEEGQVLGYICLGGIRQAHDFIHAPRFLANRLQDFQAHGFGEHFEKRGDFFELGRGKGGWRFSGREHGWFYVAVSLVGYIFIT